MWHPIMCCAAPASFYSSLLSHQRIRGPMFPSCIHGYMPAQIRQGAPKTMTPPHPPLFCFYRCCCGAVSVLCAAAATFLLQLLLSDVCFSIGTTFSFILEMFFFVYQAFVDRF